MFCVDDKKERGESGGRMIGDYSFYSFVSIFINVFVYDEVVFSKLVAK